MKILQYNIFGFSYPSFLEFDCRYFYTFLRRRIAVKIIINQKKMFYNLNILQIIFFFDLLYLSYLSYKYYFTKIKRHEDNYSIDKKQE